MILTCPSCATRYFADDASVGPDGRTVRCAACSHSWFVSAHLVLDRPADAGAPFGMAKLVEGPASEGGLTREQIERARQASAPHMSTAARARAKQVERQKREHIRHIAISWGAGASALALTAGLAIAARQDVAHIWPNTASAYAAIGMPVNITGLEFSQIDVSKTFDGPTPILVVSGSVRNISRNTMKPPVVRFSLRDDGGDEISHWLMELPGKPIQPGGARTFRSSLDSPPDTAADLEATFATKADILADAAPRAHPVAPPAHDEGEAAIQAEENAHVPEGGPDDQTLTPLMSPSAFRGASDGLAPRLPPEPSGSTPGRRPGG